MTKLCRRAGRFIKLLNIHASLNRILVETALFIWILLYFNIKQATISGASLGHVFGSSHLFFLSPNRTLKNKSPTNPRPTKNNTEGKKDGSNAAKDEEGGVCRMIK